jgi:hypothetical protein
LCSIRVGERRIQFGAKYLEINRGRERFELIAEIAPPLQAIIDVEKFPRFIKLNRIRNTANLRDF